MLESPGASLSAAADTALAIRLLKEYLQHRVEEGEQRIWLSQPARQALRAMMQQRAVPATARPINPTSPARPAAVKAPPPAPGPAAPSFPVAFPASTNPVRATWPKLSREERERELAALREAAERSQQIRDLGSLREIMVFAVGNPEAEIMFVGEAPGYDEEKQREPFVGKAGQKLNDILKTMNLQRSDVYISNICKYRPKMEGQLTDNRKPTMEEMQACLPFIRREIEVVQPKVIVALGATAAEGLLGLPSPSVGRLRGKFHDYLGVPVMVTYHPSYILRNDAVSERRKVWEDMLLVMEQVGLPISERQRLYFSRSK